MLKQHRSDCAKLALLNRFGGIYMDSSVLALHNVGEALDWAEIERDQSSLTGYYLKARNFVENYILGCRRGSPLMSLWHQTWLQYWNGRHTGETSYDRFFANINASLIPPENKYYLIQHACYQKLLDFDIGGFRELERRAHLRDSLSPTGALWL